ncbi:hypothetical protein EB008_03720 [bacterium]|nr:hypothetical protein [bacterium]
MSGSFSTQEANPFAELLALSGNRAVEDLGSMDVKPHPSNSPIKKTFPVLDDTYQQARFSSESRSSFSALFLSPKCPRSNGDGSPWCLGGKAVEAFSTCFFGACEPALPNPSDKKIEKALESLKEAYRAFSEHFYFSQMKNAKDLTHKVFKVLKIFKEPELEDARPLFKTIEALSLNTAFPIKSLENSVTPLISDKKDLLLLQSKTIAPRPRNPKYVEIMKKMVQAKITPKVYFCLPVNNPLPETMVERNGKSYSSYPLAPDLDGMNMLAARARGGDFTSYYQRWKRTISPDELDRFCLQLMRHVDRMHDLNIFHRDIKPENVVVNWEDGGEKRVQLIDFGLATEERFTNRECGTRAFMAPELCRKWFFSSRGAEMAHKMSSAEVDLKYTDLYALGITLFEIFTGKSFEAELEHHAKRVFNPSERTTFEEFFTQKQAAIDLFLDDPQRGLPPNKIQVLKGFLRLMEPDQRMSIKNALAIWTSS